MFDKIATLENIDDKIKKVMKRLETIYIARILKFYPETGRADIQPILNTTDNYGKVMISASVLDCPVSMVKSGDFFIRIPYKIGDLVIVAVNKDNYLDLIIDNDSGDSLYKNFKKFNKNDSIILGGMFSNVEEKMTNENSEDLLISNINNDDKIVLKKSGGIEIISTSDVIVNCSKAEVTASDSVTFTSPNSTFTGNVKVGGDIDVVGKVDIAKTLTALSSTIPTMASTTATVSGGLSIAGADYSDHKHNTTVTKGDSAGTYISTEVI